MLRMAMAQSKGSSSSRGFFGVAPLVNCSKGVLPVDRATRRGILGSWIIGHGTREAPEFISGGRSADVLSCTFLGPSVSGHLHVTGDSERALQEGSRKEGLFVYVM